MGVRTLNSIEYLHLNFAVIAHKLEHPKNAIFKPGFLFKAQDIYQFSPFNIAR